MAAKKKAKEVKVWAHVNRDTGEITWIGQPDDTKSFMTEILAYNERVVRVSIKVL